VTLEGLLCACVVWLAVAALSVAELLINARKVKR